MTLVRKLLGIEAAAFAAAALVHAGVLLSGYQHRQAGIAESVIAAVLALGLLVSVMRPQASRNAALAVQGFALLGTFVGITMISIGVGPQSRFDISLHVFFVAILVSGLVMAAKMRPEESYPRIPAL